MCLCSVCVTTMIGCITYVVIIGHIVKLNLLLHVWIILLTMLLSSILTMSLIHSCIRFSPCSKFMVINNFIVMQLYVYLNINSLFLLQIQTVCLVSAEGAQTSTECNRTFTSHFIVLIQQYCTSNRPT